MPRMATRRRASVEGAGTRTSAVSTQRGNRHTSQVVTAPALNLLARGAAGWAMPRLDGVAASHKVWRGDRVAAAIGDSMLRSGIATGETWGLAERDPFKFIQLSMSSFIDAHGGASIREGFRLNLTLGGTLNEYSMGEREVGASELFLTVDPVESGYLVLGPTVRILEEQHPRLPATFFHLLSSALNRWVRVYDYRDALDHVERLLDWYSADPDSGEVEVPDVAGSIPASFRRKPLSKKALKRLLPSIASETREWMERALETQRLSLRQNHPALTEAMQEDLGDCNAPLPSLLMVFSPRDNVEACFDAEAESMMEVSPEPSLIIPLDATDPDHVRDAFNILGNACETLAAASKLMAILPDSQVK
ncbi:MAG: hypothetical protein ABL967_19110 [Bryobacteraceae bacterium]